MGGEYRSIRNLPTQEDENEYLSVRHGPRLNLLASRRELEALFANVNLIADLHLDILDVLKVARTTEIVTPECERAFRRRYLEQGLAKRDMNIQLFLWIISKARFNDILTLLRLIGHRSVASEIEISVYGRLSIAEISSATIHNTDAVQTFYYNWKKSIDNNVFSDRLAAIRWMSGELEARMSSGDNYSKRQLDANKFVFLHILRMPMVRDPAEREATLNRMKQAVPSDLDHGTVDLVHAGCMAWSAIMQGNIGRAFEKVRQFQALILPFNLPFLKCFLYQFTDGTYRMLALMHPENYEYRRLCIFHCENGINICQNFENEVCLQQRRMLVISIVYLLLGIHVDLTIAETPPDKKSRMLANAYLQDMRKSLFKDIESRRDVQYYLCMARLYEEEDLVLAIDYASQSLNLSADSSIFVESIANIAKYEQRLKAKLAG